MITVNEALKKILMNVDDLNHETVNLNRSLGRVASHDIKSNLNLPQNNLSSMDGYAIKYKDAIIINNHPASIVGESSAGKPFEGNLGKSECIKISTGAVLPINVDCIILKEKAIIKDSKIVLCNQKLRKNEYIRLKGLNIKTGDIIIKKNTKITTRDIGITASTNQSSIKAYKKPIISILSTGNELGTVGQKLNRSQIISSNSFMLQSLINSLGGKCNDLGIARDDKNSLKNKILKSKGSDILLTTGGISIGDHDLVKSTLIDLGLKVVFWKIAMRPGKPILYGKLNKMSVLCFPGNPVSTFVSSIIYLIPLINKLQNISYKTPIKEAITSKDIEKNDEREDYIRAKLSFLKNNEIIAEPFAKQDSSMTNILANSQGLIIRKRFANAIKAGSKVLVIPFVHINQSL